MRLDEGQVGLVVEGCIGEFYYARIEEKGEKQPLTKTVLCGCVKVCNNFLITAFKGHIAVFKGHGFV